MAAVLAALTKKHEDRSLLRSPLVAATSASPQRRAVRDCRHIVLGAGSKSLIPSPQIASTDAAHTSPPCLVLTAAACIQHGVGSRGKIQALV